MKTKRSNMREEELLACAYTLRSSHRRCSTKKGFFKNFAKITGKQASGLRASALVFSCEFCEFFQNTYFTERLSTTASVCYIGSCYFYETKVILHNLN